MVIMLTVALLVAGAIVLGLRARPAAALPPLPKPQPEMTQLTRSQLDAAVAPQREAIEATRRPLLRVALEDFPEDAPTASKVGGRAWWPEGTPAPVGENGKPMRLLAQLNFAEMPALPGYPDSGLLQFLITPGDFYGASFERNYSVEDLATQRNFRVAYWPDTDGPATTLPAGARDDDYFPHDPGKPRRMRFAADTETVSSSDYRFHRIFGGSAYEPLEAWADAQGLHQDAVSQVLEDHSGGGHKVGGYPFFTQEDPRNDGPYELLLQLDSDDHMMWGDTGVGGFFIDPADLARRDFSRVMYTWDCY